MGKINNDDVHADNSCNGWCSIFEVVFSSKDVQFGLIQDSSSPCHDQRCDAYVPEFERDINIIET